MSKYISINIRKPIWSGDKVARVGIREKYIWQAKREKKKLRITVPQGEVIISVKEFLKDAERMEQIFKFPDRPMILYHKTLYLDKKNPVEDVTIPFDTKERLREIWIEKLA